MTVTLYRTLWSKPGIAEPIQVRCATPSKVWLTSGYPVPRHRDDYEDYWDTEEEAMMYWLERNKSEIENLKRRLAMAEAFHAKLLTRFETVK